MKTRICLCALLLAHCARAALFDFNDVVIGTEVTSLNPYGSAVISTRLWVTEDGATVAESFTRGVIDNPPFLDGSPSVVIQASSRDAPGDPSNSRWNIEIAVSFQTPVPAFGVDVYSGYYSTYLMYSGVNELGETFTLSGGSLGGFHDRFDHFDITAPTGSYITGFHFSQFEDVGSIFLAMDNLYYPTAIPETIGLPTFAFAICGILFFHRWMRAARK